MKRLIARLTIACSLLAMLIASAPAQPAQAQTKTQEMPAELQEALLAASSQPFTKQGGSYTTEYNGLNYRLTTAGLQTEEDDIQWGISLRGMGRGEQADDIQMPGIVQAEGRLEYRRDVITEWYRDTALGVEQGFTISESPQGNGKLVLHLDLSTDLEGHLNEDESGIFFAAADGLVLHYDNLKAFDANGVELEAKMVYSPAQVVIHVDDRGAAYPITIDPIISLEQKVVAMDGAAGDNLGYSVAIDGDTAVVGAINDDIDANANQGSAYVFVRIGTTWTQQAKLTASDGATGDNFGWSVAISEDTVLVGVRNSDVSAADQGAVYVFVRSGTTWTQQAKLTASDAEASDVFGWSVALAGDTALVGAQWDNFGSNGDQGSAYIFVRSGTTWTQQVQLTASDGAAGDTFGNSVALSDNTALVAAQQDDSARGSVYVFVRSGTTWTQQQKLAGSAAGDQFGQSVALSGNTALVGAPNEDISGNNEQGAAYIFTRNVTIWSQQAKITALDGTWGDYFGNSVALSGDTALVGADQSDDGVQADQGAAYLFGRSGTAWTQQLKLIASVRAENDNLGWSVALSDDTALVGAVGANADQGAAYFYQAYRSSSDLAVSAVTGSGITAYSGDTVYLTASVTNYGPASAANVMCNVSLPAGLTYMFPIR
jgi:uncharacterized repeat protein (TIGR01451 family)